MAVLTYAGIQNLALDELQANVTTDAPIDTTAGGELERAIQDAQSMIWESSGGTLTPATHATLWTPSPAVLGTQTLSGALVSIEEIVHFWVGTTVGSTGWSSGDGELELVELSQIHWLRTNSASGSGLGTYAESKFYAAYKLATATPGNVNKWTV